MCCLQTVLNGTKFMIMIHLLKIKLSISDVKNFKTIFKEYIFILQLLKQ